MRCAFGRQERRALRFDVTALEALHLVAIMLLQEAGTACI